MGWLKKIRKKANPISSLKDLASDVKGAAGILVELEKDTRNDINIVDATKQQASDIKAGASVATNFSRDAGQSLDGSLAGSGILVDPEAWRDESNNNWGNVYDSALHYWDAPFAEKPLDEAYYANVDWTAAHAGVEETDEETEARGIYVDQYLNESAAGAGSVFGGALGPIGGAIAGFAVGWGAGSQFSGNEIDGNQALEAAAIGVAAGVASGYGSEYLSSSEMGLEGGDIAAAEGIGSGGGAGGSVAADSALEIYVSGAIDAVVNGAIDIAASLGLGAIVEAFAPDPPSGELVVDDQTGVIYTSPKAKTVPISAPVAIGFSIIGLLIIAGISAALLKGNKSHG